MSSASRVMYQIITSGHAARGSLQFCEREPRYMRTHGKKCIGFDDANGTHHPCGISIDSRQTRCEVCKIEDKIAHGQLPRSTKLFDSRIEDDYSERKPSNGTMGTRVREMISQGYMKDEIMREVGCSKSLVEKEKCAMMRVR